MEDRLHEALRVEAAPPPPIDDVRRRGRRLRWRHRLVAAGAGVAAVAVVVAVLATGSTTERVEIDGEADPAAAIDSIAFADGFTLLAYLEPTATADEILAVELELSVRQDVVEFEYLDQAGAYEQYRSLFADRPELLEVVQPGDLPPSFRIRLAGGCGTELRAILERLPGMYKVIRTPRC